MSGPLLAPFAGLRVAPHHADAVLAPPYDVLSVDEARAAAEGRPESFLHVSRPEIDLPPETPAGAPALYGAAAARFARMIEDGVLLQDAAPRFYAWRMEAQGRAQTGARGRGIARRVRGRRDQAARIHAPRPRWRIARDTSKPSARRRARSS